MTWASGPWEPTGLSPCVKAPFTRPSPNSTVTNVAQWAAKSLSLRMPGGRLLIAFGLAYQPSKTRYVHNPKIGAFAAEQSD